MSAVWAGLRARASRISGSDRSASIHTAAPGVGGACIRGFLWALVFEAISLAMLGVVVFGLYSLQR